MCEKNRNMYYKRENLKMSKITVRAKEEYRVKVITDIKEDEFFFDSFCKARHELEDIIKDTKVFWSVEKNHEQFDFSNNIIAFSGDRGQGKSSAMLSFSNFLKNKDKIPFKEFLQPEIQNNNFVVLDRIDPTKFEKNENILLIILGKIFNVFCEKWEKANDKNIGIYNEMLDLFQMCYSEILTIKNNNTENPKHFVVNNALDSLGRIGDSGNLKKDLQDLIKKFFDFLNKCEKESYNNTNTFLVIQLDDTDLNTDNAYNIVEDVRKYFMIPNVIILMAIDIKQLTQAIEQKFIKDYEKIDNFYNGYLASHHNIAVKYIDKLIPGNRKIILPKITPDTDEYAEKTEIEYLAKTENNEEVNVLEFKDTNDKKISEIQEAILRYIYEKTGIIFIKPKTYVHKIVPSTMRELANFLSILYDMENIKNDYDDPDDLQLRLKNLKNFEVYFTEVWIANHIHPSYKHIVENLINASWITKNKQIIKDLKEIYLNITSHPSGIVQESQNNAISNKILETFEIIENKALYTLADVRELLFVLENEIPQEENYKLTFAIRTLYTIYLNTIFCNQLLHEYKQEEYDEYLLFDFVGGEIFGTEANNFVRKENKKFARGTYEIDVSQTLEIQYEMRNILEENYWIAAFLGDFVFPNSQDKQPKYKNQYKASNNAYCQVFDFNITSPILNSTYPSIIANKIEADYNFYSDDSFDRFFETAYYIRHQCILIVSNIELTNYLSKKLKKLSSIRSNDWTYTNHLVNMYERIEDNISLLSYYPLENDWEPLKEYLSENSDILDNLYEFYKKSSLLIREQIMVQKEMFQKKIEELTVLRGTKTFEFLKGKIDEVISLLESWYDTLEDYFIYSHLKSLYNLRNAIKDHFGELNADGRTTYQSEYNRIIRSLKDTFTD